MPKFYLDLTSLAQWRGPVVGILRVQQHYARYALANVEDVVFTLFDPRDSRTRTIRPGMAKAIIEGGTRVYLEMLPAKRGNRASTADRLPVLLQEPYWWVTRFRRKLALLLEARRIGASSHHARRIWASLQAPLLKSRRMRQIFMHEDGRRIDLPSLDQICGSPVVLAAGDVTLGVQNDWSHTEVEVLLDARDRSGSKHVALCHDVIPIRFPQWYRKEDVEVFEHYCGQVFERADRVIFTTQFTYGDAADYCVRRGKRLAPHSIVPLGSDLADGAVGSLPSGLEPAKFALYVSTLEPRKNHVMLLEAWRRLLRDGTVAASGFKLVFVGRVGWMVDDLVRELQTDLDLKDTVIHLTGIDDARLAALYREAAFCLYPSIFEGYGLPPVEALQRGKALIVSTTGSLPEVVGDFAVLLDPMDVSAWTDRIRAWIQGSPEPLELAARARRDYRAVTWEKSARRFFEAALA